MDFCTASCLAPPAGNRCNGRPCLVEAAKNGDRQAQEVLFAAISRFVLRQASGLCRNGHDAEDLSQSACLQVFQHLTQLRCPNRLRPWVKTIVLNSHRMAVRHRLCTPSQLEPLREDAPGPAPEPSLHLDARRAVDAVLGGIQSLPPSLRGAFELRVVQGRNTAEAAAALNVSAEAVRTRLARARRALRRAIEELNT